MEQNNAATHEIGLAGEMFFTAEDLHKAMADHRMAELAKKEARKHELAQTQAEQIKQLMIPIEITKDKLTNFLRRVQQAADHGDTQSLILRFPSDLCSDRGRAINNSQPGWEETLVGVPRQLYDVWHEKLQPRGFGLHAEVIDFPDGMPGDIGLFCRW